MSEKLNICLLDNSFKIIEDIRIKKPKSYQD